MKLSICLAALTCLTAVSTTTLKEAVWQITPTQSLGYDSVNSYLRGNIFESIEDVRLVSLCAGLCLKDARCQSFNMRYEHLTCDLNRATDLDHPEQLLSQNGSRYYRRSDWEVDRNALGECHSNPCKNKGRCIESCDDRNQRKYQCICLSAFTGDMCQYRAESAEWSKWTEYSPCTASCGDGVSTRRRFCTDNNKSQRSPLDCFGSDIEFKYCEMGPCPRFSDWSPWSACQSTKHCGLGSKTRDRTCTYNGKVGEDRRCVGPVEDTTTCQALDCLTPIRLDGAVGEGVLQIFNEKNDKFEGVCGLNFDQQAGDVACRQMGFAGVHKVEVEEDSTSTYLIKSVLCEGTEDSIASCRHLVTSSDTTSSDTCNKRAKVTCKVNGGWGAWSAWSECSVSCANGIETRSRNCDYPPAKNGGAACEGEAVETKPCEKKPCPVPGYLTQWTEWGKCDQICGDGNRYRTRTCVQPKHDGASCPEGDMKESEACNIAPCPKDGKWNDWQPYGECSLSCGGGIKISVRTCTEVQFGGKDCEGPNEKSEVCNDIDCPEDGKWKPWSGWSTCTESCDSGETIRTRECISPKNGGKDCEGDSSEKKACNETPCPKDGVWMDWGPWPECDKECGGGSQTRVRECDDPKFGGLDCPANEGTDTRQCNIGKCPIDGKWGNWTAWEPCSVTCGGGKEQRTRTCIGPFWSGAECQAGPTDDGKIVGEIHERECNVNECPVDGKWTTWSPWTNCSKTCGGGTTQRTRECNPPAKFGGKDCEGNSIEIEDCNDIKCPVDGRWEFTEWSPCVDGKKTRDPIEPCIDPLLGGNPCPPKPLQQEDIC